MSALCQKRTSDLRRLSSFNSAVFDLGPSQNQKLSRLLQPGCAHAVEEFGHRADGIGNVLLNPCDRNVWLQFLEPSQCLTRLVNLAGLCKAGDVNAVSAAQSRTLLDGLTPKGNRFIIIPCEIVSSSDCHVKYRILRIMRAHPDSLLGMRDSLFRSASEGGRQS